MAKDIDRIFKEFQNELKANDKKVEKEINTKCRVEMSKEFSNFVKTNNCKIIESRQKRGDKNEK